MTRSIPGDTVHASPARSRVLASLALAGVAGFAVLLRLPGLGRDLWEDEVIAASHAEQPFWRLPVEVMRNDVHPFLYFLQLHAWSLLGSGDLWLKLNSICWNTCAIASMFFVTRRLYGQKCSWISSILFALSAPVVWMAQELRPYSFLYSMLVWAFFFVHRGLGPRCRKHDLVAALLFCVTIIYSHAIGFFVVFLLGVFGFVRIVQNDRTARGFARWLALFGLCAFAATLPLAVGLMRDANLGDSRGLLADLLEWMPRLLLPRGNLAAAIVVSTVVYVGIVLLGTAVRETRLMTLVFVLLPILLAVGLDAAHFRLFKLNVFSTFITPFVVIVIARLASRMRGSRGWIVAGLIGSTFAGASVLFLFDRVPTTGFRAAAELIRADAVPGDIVYVPQQSIFWGMARYMGTARRGWQLEVAPPLSPQWQRMYGRLGPRFVAAFDLSPQTQTLPTQSGPALVVGNDALPRLVHAPRVWLVTYPRADLPAGFPPRQIGSLEPAVVRTIGFLDVRLYR